MQFDQLLTSIYLKNKSIRHVSFLLTTINIGIEYLVVVRIFNLNFHENKTWNEEMFSLSLCLFLLDTASRFYHRIPRYYTKHCIGILISTYIDIISIYMYLKLYVSIPVRAKGTSNVSKTIERFSKKA